MNATQLEYQATGAGKSQCDLILERLERMPGAWVSEPELLALSGSHAVHARMGDLRKRGHAIENRVTHHPRPGRPHQMHSEYRIISSKS